MVLGKLPVPGRPTIWITVGQGPAALAVGAGGGCLDIFTLIYPFPPLSPSLWETARYRLKNCLKGPLNPKQPTKTEFAIFISSMRSLFPRDLFNQNLFIFTAASVVPCGGRKMSPRHHHHNADYIFFSFGIIEFTLVI